MSLVWRDQLSVGNDAIDNDHKYLIELINRVEVCLSEHNQHQLSEVLDSLARYAEVHFEREERLAEEAGYVQTPNLQQSHAKLMDNFFTVRSEFKTTGAHWSAEAADRFIAFLRGWLINHVIKEDLLMKPSFKKLSPTFVGK